VKNAVLIDCIVPAKIIATIGICKNAGKTTVLNYLVEAIYKDSRIGITSIGYDGEESDFITMLPKPKIVVHPGMFVVTSASCLEKTDVDFLIVCDTGFTSAIGPIVIVKILTEGSIEVSGPSMVSQIKEVNELMLDLGCQKIIVDGAAGRVSFAADAECSILSIGAAVAADMDKVIRRAKHLVEMLSLKEVGGEIPKSLITPYTVKESSGGLMFIFSGAMADKDLSAIMDEYKDASVFKTAVVKDAAAIFISPGIYHKFIKKNGAIRVRNPIKLVALTVNPMSPYGEWFNAEEFRNSIEEISTLPVYNIKEEEVVISEK
jgi:hypothetical protein